MSFQASNRPVSLSVHVQSSRLSPSTAGDLLKSGQLCQPLQERLNHGRDQAAFDYLVRETSFQVFNDCVRRVPDQQITGYLLEQVFLTASLLASEAFTGIDIVRQELKSLGRRSAREELRAARANYDRSVEKLGQYAFALNRRLHQLETFMAGCPLGGSAEALRGLYGQRLKDLAGDVRFIRQELGRWVRRFVPLQRGLPDEGEDRVLLVGRIDAVADELGLRTEEIRETLRATLFEQLVLFDPSLSRKKLFRRELENILDVERLIDELTELFDRVQIFDEGRQPEDWDRMQAVLATFAPEEFMGIGGVRDSDKALFVRCIEDLRDYGKAKARLAPNDDPIKVFLLLIGDLLTCLRRQRKAGDFPNVP